MDRFILHEIYGMSAEDRKRFDLGQYADDGSILEDTVTGETYMDGWEPEDATFIRDLGWVPALLNTLAAETATQHAEVERLTAELKEARLTLAAEQGRAEGAPSQGWRWTGRVWFHPPTCMVVEPAGRLWRLNPDAGDPRRWRRPRFDDMSARAAMLAADATHAAHPSTPPASP